WFSHYPFGHPMFLAIGQLFSVIWLVPPVLGAACVALIYAIGKRLYNASTGLLAAVLLLSSPFFLMTASNFMSHNTAVFTILAALFLLTLQTKRRIIAMFVAGVFIGLLFNIRPLTAVAFMPVLGVFMGYELLRAGPDRLKLLREDLAFSAGALLLLGAYFFYNQMTTGDFNTTAYEIQGTFNQDTVGFSGTHSVTAGIQNQQELLSLLLLVANGWPVAIGLIVAALPFLLGTKNRWDYFLGASFLAIVSAPILYQGSAIMHGPRYWYEALPFLILLTAHGFQSLQHAATNAGDWLARRFRSDSTPTPSATVSFAVYGLAGLLIVFSLYGWLFGQRETWAGAGVTTFTPSNASQLEGFNFTDRRLPDLADEMDLDNALILVENCPHWWCYGSVFWLNSPSLDGNVVWAELQGNEDDLDILDIYEDRKLYVANYGFDTIRRASKAEIVRDVEERMAAADDPVPPSDLRTPAERDEIRRQDLETVRTALDLYAQENGEYPNTRGQVQTLCAYTTLDVGCNLAATPVDPLGSPIRNGYWYRADGTSYVVIALREVVTEEPGGCPDDLADGENRYCILGTLP
ncbi:MAG: glycosyltransferase family 39 protein, partial [Chloroflexi bacterium]|nr:glycosyltransferase family 39 protein [Chloroflexota bacterium]